MIYFISDTHFNHDNILKYCKRPFKDVKDMNDALIKNWNSVVKDDDTIYHLGDLALGDKNDFVSIAKKLNGNKYLIRGNHDNFKVSFYEENGFKVLKNPPIKLDKYKLYLSHTPRMDSELPSGYINIHGHIHNNILNDLKVYPLKYYSPNLHFNVSVDVIGFTPISIDDLLKKIDKIE